MDDTKFKQIYGESRNGANEFYRHPLVRSFIVSDGVNDCANCGLWWLVDIAATELPAVLSKNHESLLTLTAAVKKGKARLSALGSGDVEFWKRKIDYTDMPDGDWKFFVSNDGDKRVMILPTEY